MAEELEAHAPSGVSGYGFEYVLCRCDRTNWMKAHEFPAHQADALTAAGFGLVKEAQAKALREGWNLAAEHAREIGLFYDTEYRLLLNEYSTVDRAAAIEAS
jgi:hypothetical protein